LVEFKANIGTYPSYEVVAGFHVSVVAGFQAVLPLLLTSKAPVFILTLNYAYLGFCISPSVYIVRNP
jgi:hypothetical protein